MDVSFPPSPDVNVNCTMSVLIHHHLQCVSIQSLLQHEGHNGECWLHYNCDRLVDHEWDKNLLSKLQNLPPVKTHTGARTAWCGQVGSADASVDPSSQILTTAVRDRLLLVLEYENKFNIPRKPHKAQSHESGAVSLLSCFNYRTHFWPSLSTHN